MAWQATDLINLSGGHRIEFGDRQELNGQTKLALLVCVRRGSTGWFPNTRKLVYRQGHVELRVQGTGNLVNFGVCPQGSNTPVFRGVPDSPQIREKLAGKASHFALVIYNGTKPAEQRIRIVFDGIEFAVAGTGTVPTSLSTVTNKTLFLGFTDLLQQSVGNLAIWTGPNAQLTDMQAVALWNRYKIGDIAAGVLDGPHGEAVDIPAPLWWWPCSGDTLPDVAPRIGTVHGTAMKTIGGVPTPSIPALDPKVPISPRTGPDAIAASRFCIKNYGAEGEDAQPYVSVPAIEGPLPDGSIFIAYSRGNGHDSPDQDIWTQKITNGGSAFSWPKGQPWPMDQAVGVCALDTTESCRGNALKLLSTGRLIHSCNYRYTTTNPTPPPAGPPPDPSWTSGRLIRDSDDSGKNWTGDPVLETPWRYLWPGYAIGLPNSAQFCELSDGSVVVAGYRKPFSGAPHRNIDLIRSTDGCRNWAPYVTVHDGSIDGFEWEEGQLGWISRGHPLRSCGTGWALVARVDYPVPQRLFVFFSPDVDARTWDAGRFLVGGWNTPVWRETEDGILLLTRLPQPGNSDVYMNLGISMLHFFSDGFGSLLYSEELRRDAEDGANMGHGMILNPATGRPLIIVAHARDGNPYAGGTRCEIIDKLRTW